jgi:hypothetical protein
MAKTRGSLKRERALEKRPEGKEHQAEPRPATSEQDSTIRHWGGYIPRPHKSTRASRMVVDAGGGVPWAQLPSNALYTVFEALLQDKKAGVDAVSGPGRVGAARTGLQRAALASGRRTGARAAPLRWHAPRAAQLSSP